MLVPNAVSVQNNRLPYLSDETNQNQIMDSIYKKLNKKINVVDVRNKLKEHRDDYIYYNSDHHWTSLGAFYAYQAWQKQQGNDAASLEDYEQYGCIDIISDGTLANGTWQYWD